MKKDTELPLSDPLKVVDRAVATFKKLDIPYMVGGSLASSLYGIPRATQDVDIVADLTGVDLDRLVKLLEGDFFVDGLMIKKAVRSRACFNIIDKEEMYKLDIFVLGRDELSVMEMARRKAYRLAGGGNRTIYLCSPEDIVAHKLYWYKSGGQVSERQWNDALNVIKVQQNKLDLEYLKKVSATRGVLSLLKKMLDSK